MKKAIPLLMILILLLPVLSLSEELDPSIFYGTWVMETVEDDGSYKLISIRFLDDGTLYNTVSLFTNGEPAGTGQRKYTWSTSKTGIIMKDKDGKLGSMNLFSNGTIGSSIAKGYKHIGDLSGIFTDESVTNLDDNALMLQYEIVRQELFSRNMAHSGVPIPVGEYVAGEDIPAVKLEITAPDNVLEVLIIVKRADAEDWEIGDTWYLGTYYGSMSAVVNLKAGDTLQIFHNPVTIRLFTGLY